MGFAAGLKTGSGLVQSVIDNERQAVIDARADEEYQYKKGERERVGKAWDAFPKYGLAGPASATAIPEDYLTPAEIAAQKAGPAVPATPGAAAGVAPAAAVPPATPGAATGAAPDVPVPGTPGAALGNAPAAAPPVAPAAAAPPPISEAMQNARQMYNVAVATRDLGAVTNARNNLEAVDQREILGQAGKMTPEEASAYVQKHANLNGGLQMAVTEVGPGKYRLTTWDKKDGKGRESMLNGAQIQQLAASHMLMEKYPDKGMTMAASVHKDLDALVKEHNAELLAQNTQANTAVHNFDTLQQTAKRDAASAGNAAGHLKLARDKFEQEKWKPIGPSDDNKGLLMIDAQGNTKINPLPAGSDASQVWNKIKGSSGSAKGSEGTFHDAKEEGVIEVNDKTKERRKNLGEGVYGNVNAPTKSQRPKALADAGIPPEAQSLFNFGGDGTVVSYTTPQGETRIYNWLDPKDQKEALAQYKQDTENIPALHQQWNKAGAKTQPTEGGGAAQWRQGQGLQTLPPAGKDPRGGGASAWDDSRRQRGL